MASSEIPIEIATELVRQGEVRLNSILSTALAADARANTLCGILGATGVAVGAAVLAEMTSDHVMYRLIGPGMIVTVGLLIGAVISAIAGAPVNFYFPGGDPVSLRNWCWSDAGWRSQIELLDATCIRYSEAIGKDQAILERGSKRISAALAIALASLVFAVGLFCALPPG